MAEIGERFGRLVIESFHRKSTPHPRKPTVQAAMVKCDCGNIKEVIVGNLLSGNTTSCGCYHREKVIASLIKYPRSGNKLPTFTPWQTHGQSQTKLYRKWKSMVRRCESEVAHNYRWYGGRGVKVCPEWRNDFMAFHDWAHATGYSDGLEIDRKDADGDYSPENCRWRTKKANIRSRDLLWDDEIDEQLVNLAQMRDISPYEIIRMAVEKYLGEVMLIWP
jgi:hypothetical protein